MYRFALALTIGVAVAAAQDPAPQTRPGICVTRFASCETCGDVARAVEELATKTFDERAAADVLDLPAEAGHRHIVRFFAPGRLKGQAPMIDLNEVRVRLAWETADGAPAGPGADGLPALKVGRKAYGRGASLNDDAWAALRGDLARFRDGYRGAQRTGVPIVLDAAPGVPAATIARALREAATTYRGLQSFPRRPGAPAETRGRWEREGAREYFEEELSREGGDAPVEKPIIILEEEVLVEGDEPKGTDFSEPPRRPVDSTVDAYGVGGGAAGAFAQRYGGAAEEREGATQASEDALLRAQRYVKQTQAPDGGFRPDAPEAVRVHTTARATLVFLADGNSHRFGPFKRTVNQALNWLRRQQRNDGRFSDDLGAHLLATQALVESYAITRDFRFKVGVEKALAYTTGLRATLHDPALALRLLELARVTAALDGPPGSSHLGPLLTLARAAAGRVEPGSWRATACAILRGVGDDEARGSPDSAAAVQGLGSLTPAGEALPWLTQAAFEVGGETWKAWNEAHVLPLVDSQQPDGSWPAAGERDALEETLDRGLTLTTHARYARGE
ncbi:MAG: hypothetical protein R3F62_31515 [Planctomycetota bacterium]